MKAPTAAVDGVDSRHRPTWTVDDSGLHRPGSGDVPDWLGRRRWWTWAFWSFSGTGGAWMLEGFSGSSSFRLSVPACP